MLLYSFKKLKYSKRFLSITCILAGFAILVTIGRIIGVVQSEQDYLRAGMHYEVLNRSFLWLGYTEYFDASNASIITQIMSVSSEIFYLFIMPLLLSFCGTDLFAEDINADIQGIVYSKIKRSIYYLSQGVILVGMISLIVVALLLFQLALSIPATLFLENQGITIPYQGLNLNSILLVCLRQGLYYSGIGFLVYSISLHLYRNKIIIYLLPMLFVLLSSFILIEKFQNDPLALTFYQSELANPNMLIYYLFLLVLFGVGMLLVYMKRRFSVNKKMESLDEILSRESV